MGICKSSTLSPAYSEANRKQKTTETRTTTNSCQNNEAGKTSSYPSKKDKFAALSTMTIKEDIYLIYDIIRDIGSGTFGLVREASKKSEPDFENHYAIKTVWKSQVQDLSFLREEVEILLSIDNHDSIIRCFEVYEDATCIHFVMEYIQGGDLFDYIINTASRRIEEKQALDMFMQMVSALQYLHIEGFMHRDIKPENFLVYYQDNRLKIKLIDFGFACHFKGNERKKDKVGSINYIAPEMLIDDPNADYNCKIDVWALGVCLYNMLAGKQPFADDDIDILAMKIRNDQVSFHHQVFTTISFNTKKLLESILNKNPDERPSASDIKVLPWLNEMVGTDEKPTEFVDYKPNKGQVEKIQVLLNTKVNIKPEFWNLCIRHLSLSEARSIYVLILIYNISETTNREEQ